MKVLGNFYITCGRCSTWRSELVLVTFLYQLYLSTQHFKGANEEPKSFKTVLKIPMQFWGHHQNEVNRNPGITYLKILG